VDDGVDARDGGVQAGAAGEVAGDVPTVPTVAADRLRTRTS
jgi:hypothetical protein